jgi:hypothetical protein
MLDVHPLHKHLRNAGEYLAHLLIITAGLLIAVQIESCVEWRAHKHIAAEAREALHNEITGNVKALRDRQLRLEAMEAQAKDDLGAMQRIISHPNDLGAQPDFFDIGCNTVGGSLDNTAWKTAESTGALDYMPYEEASTYVKIYQSDEQLLAAESRPCDDVVAILGILSQYRTEIDTKSGKIAEGSKISLEEAAAVANKLGEMRAHLVFSGICLDGAMEFNTAFVEGRKPRGSFSGSLN